MPGALQLLAHLHPTCGVFDRVLPVVGCCQTLICQAKPDVAQERVPLDQACAGQLGGAQLNRFSVQAQLVLELRARDLSFWVGLIGTGEVGKDALSGQGRRLSRT